MTKANLAALRPGAWSAQYTPHAFKQCMVSVKLDDVEVGGSPFTVLIDPGGCLLAYVLSDTFMNTSFDFE